MSLVTGGVCMPAEVDVTGAARRYRAALVESRVRPHSQVTLMVFASETFRHHSILTTARYTHLTDQTKHHAIDRINGLMDGFGIAWGKVT